MGSPPVRTEGLTKRWDGRAVVDALDLEVTEGEVFGFLGPNGAGKTTTIRLLLGLLRPTSGTARVFGLDCRDEAVAAHRRLAYVPGEASLWPQLTGSETLTLLGRVHGAVDAAYRDELVDRFELDVDRRVRTYSKGNRQKVLLVAALMVRPDLLLLDEPTSGLDPLMERHFRTCVAEARDRGQTVFLSSHRLDEVEALCDRVGILRSGALIETGTLDQLRHLRAVAVEVEVAGPVPDLSAVPGVDAVEVEGSVVRCRVQGDVSPLLRALDGVTVHRLVSRPPSLEELFLTAYGLPDR